MALPCVALAFMFMASHCQAADPFLQKQTKVSLIDQIEAVMGHDSIGAQIEILESRLEPMFRSLPKNSQNLVSHATARYALHRINVDMHGWNIAGLEPTVETFNTTSLFSSDDTFAGMRTMLPAHVAEIFHEHLGSEGFSLRDLTIVAGAIARHVHVGQQDILRKACELLDLPTAGPMAEHDMMKIITLYKGAFLRPRDISTMSRAAAEKLLATMSKVYPGWESTVDFLQDEREILSFRERDQSNPFMLRESSLYVALKVVSQVSDQFTKVQNEPECREIKEDLLRYERGDTGRIRLVDFYRAGLTSSFFYTETKEYLTAIGAIDDTDARAGPKVMVPNYVLAKSNCLASTDVYSVCCLNECEGLLGHLERVFVSPDASAEEIAREVSGLSSSTVQAPRNLSEVVLRRLEEIAIANGGRILLHGRLFSQWMHQVFPRECPYPHLTGTTTMLTANQWASQTGNEYRIDAKKKTSDVLGPHINSLDESLREAGMDSDEKHTDANTDADAMWAGEEEHFVPKQLSFGARMYSLAKSFLSFIAGLALLACVVYMLGEKGSVLFQGNAAKASTFGGNAKHFV